MQLGLDDVHLDTPNVHRQVDGVHDLAKKNITSIDECLPYLIRNVGAVLETGQEIKDTIRLSSDATCSVGRKSNRVITPLENRAS
jgi:nucleotidyltransferase/DNA polymerase involved in DNA repair